MARTAFLATVRNLDPTVEDPVAVKSLWARLWRQEPNLPNLLNDAWNSTREGRGRAGIALEPLLKALRTCGFERDSGLDVWKDDKGRWFRAVDEEWKPVARAFIANEQWRQLAARRPDFGGLVGAPPADTYREIKKADEGSKREEVGLRLVCVTGATWPQARRAKSGTGSPECPHCGASAATAVHRWWVCPRWAKIRQDQRWTDEELAAVARGAFQPRCLWECGIAVSSPAPPPVPLC